MIHKRMFALFVLFACIPLATSGRTPQNGRVQENPSGLSVPLSTGEQTFENSAALCVKNDTCDLKKVIFRKEDYMIPPALSVSDDNTVQSTRMFAGFVTNEIANLTRYSFVQFTRGCMWYSYINENKVIDTEFGVLRNFLDTERLQHVFPQWVVDSDDADPVYGADSISGNRHYFLQSSKSIPTWIPAQKGSLYGEEKPTIPFFYVTDATGPANYSPAQKLAVNMSLEFKTCLFKTSDVPFVTNGTDVDIEKSIVCFRWESKFVFDHAASTFLSPRIMSSKSASGHSTLVKRIFTCINWSG